MAAPTRIELEARLAEAKAAFHSLMLGQALVKVRDQNGEEVTFRSASRADLYAYIQDLERQLGCHSGSARPNRPMGFTF